MKHMFLTIPPVTASALMQEERTRKEGDRDEQKDKHGKVKTSQPAMSERSPSPATILWNLQGISPYRSKATTRNDWCIPRLTLPQDSSGPRLVFP